MCPLFIQKTFKYLVAFEAVGYTKMSQGSRVVCSPFFYWQVFGFSRQPFCRSSPTMLVASTSHLNFEGFTTAPEELTYINNPVLHSSTVLQAWHSSQSSTRSHMSKAQWFLRERK